MKKTEAERLNEWLHKQGVSIDEAKARLKAISHGNQRQYNVYTHNFQGPHIRIGVLGDTHFGNKWTDKKFLGDVFKEFKKSKVEAIYHTGDMTDGPWQRHQNVLEQYSHGIEAQVQDFVNDFPSINGVPIYLIDGNHDGWYIRGGSGSPGKLIGAQRDDITHLGRDEALIKINDITMMLSHPDDGSAYAYSYKPQKFVESMFKMGEKMPDIILQGHYHKLFQMHFGGVAYVCSGTTCRQTPWMRGKKISADMGAYILDIWTNNRNGLIKMTSTLLPFVGNKHEQAIK